MSYNLADIIRFQIKGAWARHTIAYQYLSRNKLETINFALLRQIVSERAQTTEESTCYIHARVVDVLNLVPKPEKFTEIISSHNINEKYSKCKVITSSNLNNNSKDYIDSLCKKINSIGMECEVSSGSVDEDFTALAIAQCYVVGYRGFSWLSASVNPNQVYWDIQEPPEFPWLVNKSYKQSLMDGHAYQKTNMHKI